FLNEPFVTGEAGGDIDVVLLGCSGEGVEKEAVGEFQGALVQVLVGAVHGIAGLKGDDLSPSPLLKDAARLSGRKVILGKRAFFLEDEIEDVDGTADVGVALLVDRPHPGVRAIYQQGDSYIGGP